jgi:CDP-glycerol glycerophosphotransferase (TagB/SpsB family)
MKNDLVVETRPQEGYDGHIVFLLTHGFAARMMIRSGMTRRLIAQGARVTAISPNADEAYFQAECQHEGVALQQAPNGTGRIASWFRTFRPYFLNDVMNNPALRFVHTRQLQHRPMTASVLAMLNRTVARLALFREFSRMLERRVNRSKIVEELLNILRPDLLVLSNPFGREETVYLIHARELNIPVVCQMLSWDNITSKGTPLLMPNYFISWGPIMTGEISELYGFPNERIYECGVSHFDAYSQKDQFTSRCRLLKGLKLPLENPYIFYGMVASNFFPNELEILTWLVDQINNHAFARPCSLVIRPHPQTISGIYARTSRELERLRALIGSRVALDIPPVLSEKLAWDLPKDDMYRLASLLAECAMCINANSTLCLDACMLDRPVISIGFDGWKEFPYEQSARQGLDYFHIAKLLAFGGIRVARSFDDLKNHINTYLCEPSLEREGRLLSVAQECGPQDGRAAERVASTLLRLARRKDHQ